MIILPFSLWGETLKQEMNGDIREAARKNYDWDHAPVSREKISDLVFDWRLYPRKEVDHQTVVQHYVKALEAGAVFPTVKVGLFKGKKTIVDGLHRVRAHTQLKRDYVDCSTLPFESEAELFAEAVRLNSSHGKRFSDIELKENIKRLKQYKFNVRDIVALVHVPASEIYREAAAPIAVLTLPCGKKIGLGNAKPDSLDLVQLKNALKSCIRLAGSGQIGNAETMSLVVRCHLELGKVLSHG